ncbi:MAG: uroporphyrinogen methyltransferase / synthase [Blastocatellia bacterium]|jgi:uroporphyrinogen III methyltransferase/synthase|nr:uroporphyrinogen methyltransferase / synthase [Blastocatellia bacterium]
MSGKPTGNSETPLAGRTVIVTRAKAQSTDFNELLEAYGARVIHCPTIAITAPPSFDPLDEAIDNLYGYDWIVFTSVNGVEFFLRRLSAKEKDAADLDEIQVCAVGESTALKLREAAVHVDVVPLKFKAEGVFEAIESYIGGRSSFEGLNFLLPRAAVARDYLPQALESAGARADAVAAYQTVSADTTERRRIETLLAGGAVDCISFTSGSTVTNFGRLYDTTDLSGLLRGVTVACIGDVTAATAQQFGLQVLIVPTESTIPALARAIADYYSVSGS